MEHNYRSQLVWTGNLGEGTATYAGYGRDYTVTISGRPDLHGSADKHFRGDAARHNPEDLFLAAISSCHLLSYLAECALAGVRVVAYEDDAHGVMVTNKDGGGRFERVTLHPKVTLEPGADHVTALGLHAVAHAKCFIANSCSVPITVEPVIV